MKVYDLATTEFETKDDLVVSIADAITEVQELEKSRNDYRDEVTRLEDENTKLRERNLELLARIPLVENEKEKETETETETKLTIKDIYEKEN